MKEPCRLFRIFVAALPLVAPAAFADGKSGFAIHAGIGPTFIRDQDGSETFRGTSFGYTLGGEFRFNDYFALGLNIFSLGSTNDTIASVDTEIGVRGFDFTGRIIFPVSESVELFGLIGNATYTADVEPGLGTGLFGSEAWVFGGGIDMRTSEKFSIRVEGRYFRGDRDETGGMATVGFAYRF